IAALLSVAGVAIAADDRVAQRAVTTDAYLAPVAGIAVVAVGAGRAWLAADRLEPEPEDVVAVVAGPGLRTVGDIKQRERADQAGCERRRLRRRRDALERGTAERRTDLRREDRIVLPDAIVGIGDEGVRCPSGQDEVDRALVQRVQIIRRAGLPVVTRS